MERGYTAPAVDQTIEWTAFNYPKRITATVLGATQQIASFAYGPDRQRWRMVYESGSASEGSANSASRSSPKDLWGCLKSRW